MELSNLRQRRGCFGEEHGSFLSLRHLSLLFVKTWPEAVTNDNHFMADGFYFYFRRKNATHRVSATVSPFTCPSPLIPRVRNHCKYLYSYVYLFHFSYTNERETNHETTSFNQTSYHLINKYSHRLSIQS